LIISKGDDIDQQDVVDKMENFLDYKTQDIRDIKPDRDEFLRGMKVANFALNIIEPSLAEDRLYELNTTVDTWMVKAFWPGISYRDISSDPFAYTYLASQTAKLARRFDVLTQEMQAIMWVAMIDKKNPATLSTSSKISEGIEQILEYFDILEDMGGKSREMSESAHSLISEFTTLEDFKTTKSSELKSAFTSMATSKRPLKKFKQQSLFEEDGQKDKLSDFVKSDGSVALYHYSNKLEGDTAVLKPQVAKEKAGSYSNSDWQASEVPRVWFYLNRGDKEKFFHGTDLYKTSVDAKRIYDIRNDPDNLIPKVKEESDYFNINELLKYIAGYERVKIDPDSWESELKKTKESKYDGVFYLAGGIPMINWFENISVKKVGAKSKESSKEKEIIQERMRVRDYKKYASVVKEAYEARPEKDPKVLPSYKSLIRSNDLWFKKLQSRIKVKFIDNYEKVGYSDAEDMQDRAEDSGILLVDKRHSENHPVFNKEQNWKFRAVHDYIVYILGDKPFGLKGELQAYNLHAKLVPNDAKPAIFSEVVGQVCYEITTGNFPNPQKACYLYGFDFDDVGLVDEDEYQRNFDDAR